MLELRLMNLNRVTSILSNAARAPIGRAFDPRENLLSGLPAASSIGGLAAGMLAPSVRELADYARAQPPARFASETASTSAQNSAVQNNATPQARELALLAAEVYNDVPNPPAGFRVANDADLGKLGLKAENLTSTQSPFRARVYVKGAGDNAQYVVAFRGSTSGGDWKSNVRQGLGLSTDHYRRALYIGSKLALASNANVTITGHSLGGGLASAAAIASGRSASTFNAAGLSEATIRQARAIRDSAGVKSADAVRAYYVRGEILSTLQDGGDRLLGTALGGILGGAAADAPEAYGQRIGLNGVRPEGVRWYQDNPVSRHGMEWILSSLH
jgi:Protein of unknown function (DUF2974)